MFDLELAINNWKRALQQTGGVVDADVAELESHLREAVADLSGKGLSSDEAFTIACARLGEHSALNGEYRKVNGGLIGRKRILWMLFGYVGGTALAHAISGLSTCIATLSAYLGLGGATAGAAAVIAGTVCWSLLLFQLYSRINRSSVAAENGNVSVNSMALLLGVMIVGSGMAFVGRIGHVRVATSQDFGVSLIWSSIGSSAIQIGVIVTCIAITLAASRKHIACD